MDAEQKSRIDSGSLATRTSSCLLSQEDIVAADLIVAVHWVRQDWFVEATRAGLGYGHLLGCELEVACRRVWRGAVPREVYYRNLEQCLPSFDPKYSKPRSRLLSSAEW